MIWQEYQEAVAMLYEQTEGFGQVRRNVLIPDRVTGQDRQVDALISINAKGHELMILIDAKFHSHAIDVREVESVAALANAVGACKAVIVAPNGWTKPAMRKSAHLGCDLRILTLEEALDLIVPEKWRMCPFCEKDCVVLDQGSLVTIAMTGPMHWWMGGACRECRCCIAWCQSCGDKLQIRDGEPRKCSCGYDWYSERGEIDAYPPEQEGQP